MRLASNFRAAVSSWNELCVCVCQRPATGTAENIIIITFHDTTSFEHWSI